MLHLDVRRIPASKAAGHHLRVQRRHLLPLFLGGAATVCVIGVVGIAGIVLGDNLYRDWKERQEIKQHRQNTKGSKSGTVIDTTGADVLSKETISGERRRDHTESSKSKE